MLNNNVSNVIVSMHSLTTVFWGYCILFCIQLTGLHLSTTRFSICMQSSYCQRQLNNLSWSKLSFLPVRINWQRLIFVCDKSEAPRWSAFFEVCVFGENKCNGQVLSSKVQALAIVSRWITIRFEWYCAERCRFAICKCFVMCE